MIYFTESQINEMISAYQQGTSITSISESFSVSRGTIKKVLKGNYPAYTGKKRALKAKEGQTKKCSKCGNELPLEAFNKGNSLFGRRSFCRECEKAIQNTPERVARRRELELKRRENPEYVKHRNKKDRERRHSNIESYKKAMLSSARSRAKSKNLDFNIDVSDIELPEVCPLLGIPLSINASNKEFSYSLDRIDSSKGYVRGNVWVISDRANRLKNNATLEELDMLVTNLKKYTNWVH